MTAADLRQIWQADGTAFGTFVTTPSAWIAELLSHQGYDTLLLDNQHGLIDLRAVKGMLRAMASGSATPLVRVSWNDPAEIMQCLDAGAAGIVCPMINDREESQRFVRACHYPPLGNRSHGPLRAQLIDPEGYRRPLAFAMIETPGSIEHLEGIAATEGLDGLFVGPWDLTLSLGFSTRADFSDPALQKLLEQVLDACRSHGLIPGIFTTRIEDAVAMQRLGYRYIILSDDTMMLRDSARSMLQGLRDQLKA